PGKQKAEGFTQLCSGYISIIDGISAIRNKYGDAHGKGVFDSELSQFHVDFVINLTGSIAVFLLQLSKPVAGLQDEEEAD
ncbi:abortive infection family protein, partial [Candidatus Kaiserbacteria bacterium]|nr:abortive infection family protein [Candidatus Kaiserbacteria bacterium]